MKKYIKVEGENKYLKVELYYSLGGLSYATYRNEPRGYYISVTPIERVNHGTWVSESFTCFTGVKHLVKEVSRKSAKAERECEAIFDQEAKPLIDYVLQEQGLTLEEVAQEGYYAKTDRGF